MPLLLAFFLGVGLVLALAGDRVRQLGYWVGLVPSAATLVWALANGVPDSAATSPRSSVEWVPQLGLDFDFALTPFAYLMTLIVSGIAVLVMIYAVGYLWVGRTTSEIVDGSGRFAATLVFFTGAMLGLVWSESIWTMFIFWEATSVTSFLLVGHKNTSESALISARRALVLTVAGGLCYLVGALMLTDMAVGTRFGPLAEVVGGLDGARVAVAMLLFLVAVATKSAQVPFHVWLPGAMAAPTPVSAFLHSATMVKAGIVLLALMVPIFGDRDLFVVAGTALGAVTMLWGAVGALRQRDAKLILAWGTVSQLGFMVVMFSTATPKAVFAGVALLTAHAVFKAALFMSVGEIDVRLGTRDVYELAGRARRLPWVAASCVLAGASMIGLPPLLGFAAKEAAVEAALKLGGPHQVAVLAVVVLGSVMTGAYTVRLLWLLFVPWELAATQEGGAEPAHRGPVAGAGDATKPGTWALGGPSVLLALGGFVGYVALGWVDGLVRVAATQLEPDAEVYHLYRWPGLTTGLFISVGIVVVGALIGWWLARASVGVRVTSASAFRLRVAPRALGATAVDRLVDGVGVVARRVTAVVQHGSLPVYLVTMSGVAAAAATPFLVAAVDGPGGAVVWADEPIQVWLAAAISLLAVASCAVDSRLGVALVLGGIGVSMTALFLDHGAADLALTQLLVETVVVVGFVMALGHLAATFPPVGQIWRGVRIVVALTFGGLVTAALLATAQHRVAEVPVAELTEAAVSEGGGNNVVNVILTDIRGLDTVGEVAVLLVVAIGVSALARRGEAGHTAPGRVGTHRRIAPGPVLRTGVAVAAPLALVFAVYLFFAGHNQPGGGFAAGLVLGAVLSLLLLAGRIHPRGSGLIIGNGLVVLVLVAIAPLLFGDVFLDQAFGSWTPPVIGDSWGKVKVGSALVFDAGVTLVVAGLVVAVLRGLGLSSLGVFDEGDGGRGGDRPPVAEEEVTA